MPLKQEHLDKSAAAENLALSLDLTVPGAIDWAITMLFYAAMHQVEAYFATKGIHNAGHGGFAGRDTRVANDPGTKTISKAYLRMKLYSINARYNAMTYPDSRVAKMKTDLDVIKTHIATVI